MKLIKPISALVLGAFSYTALGAADIQKKAWEEFSNPKSNICQISDIESPSLEATLSGAPSVSSEGNTTTTIYNNGSGTVEKTAVEKKKHKFPVIPVLLGVAAFGIGAYFLLIKPKNNNNPTTDSTLEGTLKETFSSTVLSGIPVYAVGGGKTFSGTTDGSGHYLVKLPGGSYSLLFNISDTNVIGSKAYVPSKLNGVSVNGAKTVNLDLAEYAALFPTATDAAEVIKAYRGREMGGVNKRWDHSPTKFVAYEEPGFILNEANLLQAYDWIRQYTDGFINAPTSMANVTVKKQVFNGNALDSDAIMYYTANNAGADEWFSGNNITNSLFHANPSDARNVRGEGAACVQGGDNESDIFTNNLFEGRAITPLDLKWGKFNYRLRKPGEKIYIVSGTDACEDRML